MQPEQPATPVGEPLPPAATTVAGTPTTPQAAPTAAEESDVEVLDAELADATELPMAQPVPIQELASAVKKNRGSRRKPPRMALAVRVILVVMALGFMAVFACAYRIHPYNEDGTPMTMASHRQLGLPPCNFATLTGKPCPSCGMTTSFALLVRGDVLSSLRANWVGTCLCTLWASMMVWALASCVWGKLLFIREGRAEVTLTIIVSVMVVLMLTRWTVILLQ